MSQTKLKLFLKSYGIYVFLAILFAASSVLSPAFLKLSNLQHIFIPGAILGIVAVGQTFVILTGRGGLDLSVAAVMATAAVMISGMTHGQNSLLFPGIAACLAFGMLVGLVNGLLVTKWNVQPFIATLGVLMIVQGGRFLYTEGSPKGTYPEFLRVLGTQHTFHIPNAVISLFIIALIAMIVLRKTTFGRQLYATGGNVHTAKLSGYRTDLIITMTYIISGLTAAIGGLYYAGWIGISDNWIGHGYEIDSIAAAVMGGTSFEGGRGGVIGTIAGVFILTILYNLVLLLHLPIQSQYIVKGFVIILAVSFYVTRSSH